MDVIIGFLTQITMTVGIIFLFGWIIALLRRKFCSVAGKHGPKFLLITGIVGTPIHELSHALMCLLFGHKITEIKFYQTKSTDGSLGHVIHTYNKKNIYHQIGNFFIGTAPVLLGGAFVLLFMLILTPGTFGAVTSKLHTLQFGGSPISTIESIFTFVWGMIKAIFSPHNFTSWRWWVFMVLAVMISTHMEMSASDIKSSLRGLLFISIILLLVDGIIYLISRDAFSSFVGAAVSFGSLLSAFLSLSILFLVILLLISLLIRGIGAMFKG